MSELISERGTWNTELEPTTEVLDEAPIGVQGVLRRGICFLSAF